MVVAFASSVCVSGNVVAFCNSFMRTLCQAVLQDFDVGFLIDKLLFIP